MGVFGGSPFTKAFYLETEDGVRTLHPGTEVGDGETGRRRRQPAEEPVFTKYPKFLKNHHALHFLCDTLRMAVSGGVEPMDIDP